MFSFGKNKQTARVTGEFYVNAINVMRGAEAVSTYQPVDEAEKFRVEYWQLEERKLQLLPKPKPLAGRVALVTGGASGIGRATCHALAAQGACVVVADLDLAGAEALAKELGGPDVARRVEMNVADEEAIKAGIAAGALAFGGLDLVVNNAGLSKSAALEETSAELWDLQHNVMARGSFLVSREAAQAMRRQGLGGDIVYIASKNAVAAGPKNIAYSSAKAPRPTRSGCSPPSWAPTGSGSTASTPTEWSAARGSSPAAGAPTGPRCTASGRGPGRVLRPADPAQAGNPARACRRGRARADRRVAGGDHRAAGPGRRRRPDGVPALGRSDRDDDAT